MERYMAIDDVCAWPNLTSMPDGSILAVIFNQPTHGGWEGDVECWGSCDGGKTWSLLGVPAPHEPRTNRMNVAAGLSGSGDMLVLASGWSNRNPAGKYSSPSDGEILPMWVCRSSDGGKSWEHSETVEPPPGRSAKLIPFGDIVQLPDGALGACIYSWCPPDELNAYLYASQDDGATWKIRGIIREGNINETTAAVLPDGRLLAVGRTMGDQHIELFVSDDAGRNWTNTGPLTAGRQIPGHLLVLKDGRVLLTYGIRNKGLYGIGARFSSDSGDTWTTPEILVNLETATDGGYPSSVQLKDDTVVTAYYCNGIPAHHRYHMGVVRWKAEKS